MTPFNSPALGGSLTLTKYPLFPHLLQATRFPVDPLLGPWTPQAMWVPGVRRSTSRLSPTMDMEHLSLAMALTEVPPKFHEHVGRNLAMALTEVLPKFRDHAGLNLAMVQTEVPPKFRDHVGLNLIVALTEVLPKFRALVGLSLIGALTEMLPTFDNNMNGERVRTEGAGRPGESARGGAARQGTHASLSAESASKESREDALGEYGILGFCRRRRSQRQLRTYATTAAR